MPTELLLFSDENVASWMSLNLCSSVWKQKLLFKDGNAFFFLSVKHFDNNQDTLEKLPISELLMSQSDFSFSHLHIHALHRMNPCHFRWGFAFFPSKILSNRQGIVKFHEPPTWQKQNTSDINGTLKITRTVTPNNKALRYFMTPSNIGLMNLVASWVSYL